MMDKNSENRVKELVTLGAEMVGGTVTGVLGFLSGEIEIAAGVGAASPIINKALVDISNRYLSRREKARVGAVALLSYKRIKDRLDAGEVLRSDSFFDVDEKNHSEAAEIYEGVLLKAKNEHEEKKAKLLANLFANTAFHSEVTPAVANYFLKMAERLTYRQLCLLAFIGKTGTFDAQQLRTLLHHWPELQVLRREEMDLHNSDLGTFGLLGGSGPWSDKLSRMGKSFYEVLGLDEMPTDDMEELKKLLTMCGYVFK